jgi:hypothetical protein
MLPSDTFLLENLSAPSNPRHTGLYYTRSRKNTETHCGTMFEPRQAPLVVCYIA